MKRYVINAGVVKVQLLLVWCVLVFSSYQESCHKSLYSLAVKSSVADNCTFEETLHPVKSTI